MSKNKFSRQQIANAKAVRTERIALGSDVLLKHVDECFQGISGFMPPKGGCTQLTDDEVKAALEYMIRDSQ